MADTQNTGLTLHLSLKYSFPAVYAHNVARINHLFSIHRFSLKNNIIIRGALRMNYNASKLTDNHQVRISLLLVYQ